MLDDDEPAPAVDRPVSPPVWLAPGGDAAATPVPLVWRAHTILLDVDSSIARAGALGLGYADALSSRTGLAELAVRARRIVGTPELLPRWRRRGRLMLDLFARDAFVDGRRLGLHPREFALLWRLDEEDGGELSTEGLLGELWHLRFRPETNTLAVHVSRLRAKLAAAGLDGAIVTGARGGYALAGFDFESGDATVQKTTLCD